MLELLGYGLLVSAVMILFVGSLLVKKNKNLPKIREDKHRKFAILIPARDESKVIEGLLRSIMLQTYKIEMSDVYVVVEDSHDLTVDIANRYGATTFVRKHLELKRKGYALDEVVKYIVASKKHYDAYFVMDADNILDPTFIEQMNHTYTKGYDMAIGYRNCKNGCDSVIAACSALTFTLINARGNSKKNEQTRNVMISGTGFYVDGAIVEKWGCWPFHSLTEDYEMSLYAISNNLTSYYNEKAIFYDEQPIHYRQTIPQRLRWIRGFFDSRKMYMKKIRKQTRKKHENWGSGIGELIGINPYIMMVVGMVLILVENVIHLGYYFVVKDVVSLTHLSNIFGTVLITYLVIAVITASIIYQDRKTLNLSTMMRIKAILFNPLFLTTYIPCFLKAMLKREITWEKVEHHRTFIVKN